MCRVLIYLGKQPALIYDLIYGPDNCLANQSYKPQLMSTFLNLAGFGFAAWVKNSYEADTPFYYKTTQLPFFDQNLYYLSKKIKTHCLLAHIRGVEYDTAETVSNQNIHPFKLNEAKLTLAHNGNLIQMEIMKRALVPFIKPEIYGQIKGTTDSEWIYALLLSQLEDYTVEISLDETVQAVTDTLKIIRKLRLENGIDEASPVNLFVTNGKYLVVTRFVYDFGWNSNITQAFLSYHSLWATFGEKYGKIEGDYKMHGNPEKRQNILIASEPLTSDRTTWIELPEYSITKAWLENDEILFRTNDLII